MAAFALVADADAVAVAGGFGMMASTERLFKVLAPGGLLSKFEDHSFSNDCMLG